MRKRNCLLLVCLQLLLHRSLAFTEKNVRFVVDEDVSVGTLIGKLDSDPDLSVYRISRGANSKIRFNATSLEFFVSSELDRETESIIDLLIITTPPSIIHVFIEILDVNDNSPEFLTNPQKLIVPETAPAGWRQPISGAVDRDAGANATIDRYVLTVNETCPPIFRLVTTASDGVDVVFLELLKSTREAFDQHFYQCQIVAFDSGRPPRNGSCQMEIEILDANDHAPYFGVRSLSVDWSGSINEPVFRLNATDEDIGENGRIEYRVLPPADRFFQIIDSTNLVAKNNTFDYCSQLLTRRCSLTIQATDFGVPPLMSSLDVDVQVVGTNSHDPIINLRFYPSDVDFILIHQTDVNGKTLAILSVTDGDGPVGPNSTLELVSGNEDGVFALIKRSPIQILILKDVEAARRGKYVVKFEVSDDQKPTPRHGSRTLVIYIAGIVEMPIVWIEPKLQFDIDTDASKLSINGSFVGQVATNCSDQCRFEIVNKAKIPFRIDPINGIIVTSDRVDETSYRIDVDVKLPPPSLETKRVELLIVVKKLNEHRSGEIPKNLKKSYQFSTRLNSSVGTIIGSLPKGQIYSMMMTTGDASPNPIGIFPDGVVFVAKKLRVTDDVIQIPVILRDDHFNTTQHTMIIVVVRRSNDFDPECDPISEFRIVENQRVGTVIGVLRGVDRDRGAAGAISFHLVTDADVLSPIYVDPTSGRIISRQIFDAEKTQIFNFSYRIQDYGRPSRSQICEASIKIEDLNDNAPKFNAKFFEASIANDVDKTVTTITADDADVDAKNRRIHYRILNHLDYFRINGSSGEIRVKKRITPTLQRINLTVQAMNFDESTDHLIATSFVLIKIQKKSIPDPILSTKIIRIYKNDVPGQFLEQLIVDSDAPLNWTIGSDTDQRFSITSNGKIILNDFLTKDQIRKCALLLTDHERQWRFEIDVELIDDERNDHLIHIEKIEKLEGNLLTLDNDGWRIVRIVPELGNLVKIENQTVIGTSVIGPSVYVFLESNDSRFMTIHLMDQKPTMTTSPTLCSSSLVHLIQPPDEVQMNCSLVLIGNSTGVELDHGRIRIENQEEMIRNLDVMTVDTKLPLMITLIRDVPTDDVKFTSSNILMLLSSTHQLSNSFGRVTAQSTYRIRYFIIGDHQAHLSIDSDTGELYLKRRINRNLQDVQIVAACVMGVARARVTIEVIEDRLALPINDFVVFASRFGSNIGRVDVGRDDVILDVIDEHFYVRDWQIIQKSDKNPVWIRSRFYDLQGNVKKGKLTQPINITIVFGDSDENRSDDVNENELIFSIEENQKIGSVIGTVPNPSESKYRLIDSSIGILIDQQGVLRSTKVFDREKTQLIRTKMIEQTVNRIWDLLIFIDDVNDNKPMVFTIPNDQMVRVVDEAAVGDEIFRLDWIDPDCGIGGSSKNNFQVNIIDGDEYDNLKVFNDGRIVLKHQITDPFNATFRVSDSSPPFRTNFDEVTLHFQPTSTRRTSNPKCDDSEFLIIGKTPRIGDVIGRLESPYSTSMYRIVPETLPRSTFRVKVATGELLMSTDDDLEPIYRFLVEIRPGSDSEEDEIVTCKVEIRSMLMINRDHREIENETISIDVIEGVDQGTLIAKLSPTGSEDSNLIYGFEDDDANFTINAYDGSIYTNGPIDYEEIQQYNLTVLIQHDPTNTDLIWRRRIEIRVIDENDEEPRFITGDLVNLWVRENDDGSDESISYPSIIGSSIADDMDDGQNGIITYSIISGNTSLFGVNSTSGDVSTLKPLDREESNIYELLIEARDAGIPSKSATSKILIHVEDVNDNDPTFIQNRYQASIEENTKIGTKLLKVEAVDKDDGENSRISYFLASSESQLAFEIDEKSGWLMVADQIDYEIERSYRFEVIAKDHGKPERSSRVWINIDVLDQNDNDPEILNKDLELMIDYDNNPILIVDGSDADALDRDTLRFVLSGSASQFLKINKNGEISRSEKKLKHEKLEFTVTVYDSQNHSTSANFIILPTSQSDLVWIQKPDESIPQKCLENQSKQIGVFKAAHHPNRSSSSQIQYSLISRCRRSLSIDKADGILKTLTTLNREEFEKCRIWVEARSSTTPPTIIYSNLMLDVEDANDNDPIFTSSMYKFSIVENSGPQKLGRVTAVDADSGENGRVDYQIIEGDKHHEFLIDSTGMIEAIRDVDRETIKSYHLQIQAVDHGNPRRSANTSVMIDVIDEDDNAPRFSRIFHVDVDEDVAVGTLIIQLSASDADDESNHRFTLESNDPMPFYVIHETGEVFTNQSLDYEKKQSYRIKVRLTDGIWSIETSLFVTILDVNDNPPIFENPHYLFMIQETSNWSIGVVKATDMDSNENGRISYYCNDDHYNIDTQTGSMFRIRSTFRDSDVVTVTAIDHGSRRLKTTSTVTIIDEKYWKVQMVPIRRSAMKGSVIFDEIRRDDIQMIPQNCCRLQKQQLILLMNLDALNSTIQIIEKTEKRIVRFNVVEKDPKDQENQESLIINRTQLLTNYRIDSKICNNFESINSTLIHLTSEGSITSLTELEDHQTIFKIVCNDGLWPKIHRNLIVKIVPDDPLDSLSDPIIVEHQNRLNRNSTQQRFEKVTVSKHSEDAMVLESDSDVNLVLGSAGFRCLMTSESRRYFQTLRIEKPTEVDVFQPNFQPKSLRRSKLSIDVQDEKPCASLPLLITNRTKIESSEFCRLEISDPEWILDNQTMLQRQHPTEGVQQFRISSFFRDSMIPQSISHVILDQKRSQEPSNLSSIVPSFIFIRQGDAPSSAHQPLIRLRLPKNDSAFFLADDTLRNIFGITEQGAFYHKIDLDPTIRSIYRIPLTLAGSNKSSTLLRVLVDEQNVTNLKLTKILIFGSKNRLDQSIRINIGSYLHVDECVKVQETNYQISSDCHLRIKSIPTSSEVVLNNVQVEIVADPYEASSSASSIDVEIFGHLKSIARLIDEIRRHYDDMTIQFLSALEIVKDYHYRLVITIIDRNSRRLNPSEARRTFQSFFHRSQPGYVELGAIEIDHCQKMGCQTKCATTIIDERSEGSESISDTLQSIWMGTMVSLPIGRLAGVCGMKEATSRDASSCDQLECGKNGRCVMDGSDPICQCRESKQFAFDSFYQCDALHSIFSLDNSARLQIVANDASRVAKVADADCDGRRTFDLDFRTVDDDVVVLTAIFEHRRQRFTIRIDDEGLIIFNFIDDTTRQIEMKIEKRINDGRWHRLSIRMSADAKKLSIQIDGRGKEVKSRVGLPQFYESSTILIGDDATGRICYQRILAQGQMIHPIFNRTKMFTVTSIGSPKQFCSSPFVDRSDSTTSFSTIMIEQMTSSFSILILIFATLTIVLFVIFLIVRHRLRSRKKSATTTTAWQPATEIDAYTHRRGGHVNRSMMARESDDDYSDVISVGYSNIDKVKCSPLSLTPTSCDLKYLDGYRSPRRSSSSQQHGGGKINMAYL